jgi:rRNA maturation RNase YbeY
MARVNERFLQHQGSTDVITFDYAAYELPGKGALVPASRDQTEPAPPAAASASPALHGEIYISVNDALAQAPRFGTTWQAELVRYLIHGVLHLLAYDDSEPAARRRMKRAENRLFRRVSREFSLARLSRGSGDTAHRV